MFKLIPDHEVCGYNMQEGSIGHIGALWGLGRICERGEDQGYGGGQDLYWEQIYALQQLYSKTKVKTRKTPGNLELGTLNIEFRDFQNIYVFFSQDIAPKKIIMNAKANFKIE